MSKPILHRIRQVRVCQGLSLPYVARRMNISAKKAKAQESETTDISLSELHRWQRVLRVPIDELLVERGRDLNPVISERAQMIRLMKTAASISEKAKSAPVRRLAQNLVNQLCEMMPELEGVASWHEVGQRRTSTEYGRAVERTFSDDLLRPFSR